MKRLIIISTLLTLFIFITGCGNNQTEKIIQDNKYISGQDNQYMYSDVWYGTPLQHGDEGYYYVRNKFLYFIDEESFDVYPLCNKSDCLHDKEPDETKKYSCNAYIDCYSDSAGYKIQYYDGSIYTIFENQNDNYSLFLRKFDIKNQTIEDLFKLDTPYIDDWIIHRGYLYYCDSVVTKIGENGEESSDSDCALYRVDISKSDSETEKISNYEELGLSLQQATNMQAYGNYVYYDTETVKRGTDILSADNDTFENKRYCYDIENNKNFCLSDIVKYNEPRFCGFYNDKIIYIAGKYCVFSCDLDGENTTTLFKYSEKYAGNILTDGKYIYSVDFSKGGDVYNVFDGKGKLLNRVKMPFVVDPIVPFDSNYIIYCEDGKTELKAVDKSTIAKDDKLKAKVIYKFQ